MNLYQIDYIVSYGASDQDNHTAYVVSDTDVNAQTKLLASSAITSLPANANIIVSAIGELFANIIT